MSLPLSGPVGLVLPEPNAPFSAEQVEERTSTARASSRREELDVIYLIDPVSSSATVLFVGPKVAYRTAVPRASPGGFQVGFPMVGEPFPKAESQMTTESLGTRITEGVEVQGTRTTATAYLRETWSSQALGLMLTVEASGPDRRHTAKLQNLDRQEPDASLFVIPPEYSIQD
jgi:hypothetical protein